MSFQPAFNARLIAEVKKHPCLYNHSKRGSGDTMERMRIWEMIAAAVDSNCSEAMATVEGSLSEGAQDSNKHNFVTPIRWCYFSHLSWLDPYLKDNLVLSACDGYGDNSDGYSNCVDGLSLGNVKTELDDGDCEQSTSLMEASVIDRLLASTHQISRQHKDPSEDLSSTPAGAEEEPKVDGGKSEDVTVTKEASEKKCERTEAPMQVSFK
ncbi:hypothetical protein COOONC_22367 [Cooperia oncophora]